MQILPVIFWVLLILSICGIFAPADWPNAGRISGTAWAVLFVIIGLRVFPVAL